MISTTFAIRNFLTKELLKLDYDVSSFNGGELVHDFYLSPIGDLGVWETKYLYLAISVLNKYSYFSTKDTPSLSKNENLEIVAIHRIGNYKYVTNEGFCNNIFDYVKSIEDLYHLAGVNNFNINDNISLDVFSKAWDALEKINVIPDVNLDVKKIKSSFTSEMNSIFSFLNSHEEKVLIKKNKKTLDTDVEFFSFDYRDLNIPDWANVLCYNEKSERYCYAYQDSKNKLHTGFQFAVDDFQYELESSWSVFKILN